MFEILESLLIALLAVAVLLPVIRYALRRLSPAVNLERLTADEEKYMQKQELKLMLAYFFFACVFSVFFSGALALVSSIIHASGEHLHVLTPNFRAFFAPGLLLGLTLALIPLYLIQSSLLGQDYELYRKYLTQVEGQNTLHVYKLLFAVMLVVSVVVNWYAMRWHVNIDADRIEITNLLQENRTYNMKEISSIHYLGMEGEYLIAFRDGSQLNTTYLKQVQFELIALLSERSGHRVVR